MAKQLCLLLAAASVCLAQQAVTSSKTTHVILPAKAVKWEACAPGLPQAPGLQCAVLAGDPSKAGEPYVLRFTTPDGYMVPPHWHPMDEHVTVISGTLMVGMGEKLVESDLRPLGPGGFLMMPQKMPHYARMKGKTVADVYGVGPFEINYVNPADDPRTKATSK